MNQARELRAVGNRGALLVDNVRHVRQDGETLWASTEEEGLCAVGPVSGEPTDVVWRCLRPGGVVRGVHASVDDELGRTWLSSNVGLWVGRSDALAAFARGGPTPELLQLGIEAGRANAEANGPMCGTVVRDRAGTFWFPTQDGVVGVEPERFRFPEAPHVLLVSAGVVKLAIKRYKPNATNYNTAYISKANVSIIGEKMPTFSANCDRLEGGSVIEGRFNVFADNFHHENVGYDLGKYVCDTYFAGYDSHSANYPLAGGTSTWDAFAFAQPNQASPLADRKNYTARDVVGPLRDSSSLGHAILQEGFSGGHIDNVIGMYGVHAHVIKAQNVSAGFIAGYGASVDDLILKSDSYAHGGNIKMDTVETDKTPPNTTPGQLQLKAPTACSCIRRPTAWTRSRCPHQTGVAFLDQV